MSPLVLDRLDRVRRRRGLVVICDLDGTLAPVAPSPEQARVPDPVRRALAALARRTDTGVGIVSGRPLRQVERLVDPRGIWLAGIHGFERRVPGGRRERLWSPAQSRRARRLAVALAQAVEGIPGAFVERKGPIVAVHLRRSSPAGRRVARASCTRLCPDGWEIVPGRRVLELRPRASPTKADAVRWIQRFHHGAALLYLGDDVTDEDAFRALGRADFPVLVDDGRLRAERADGLPFHTSARYRLRGPAAVGRLVALLASGRTGRAAHRSPPPEPTSARARPAATDRGERRPP